MAIKANIDENGNITAFYDTKIHKKIPAGCKTISAAQRLKHLEGGNLTYKNNKWEERGAKPSHQHKWDEESGTWAADLDAIKAEKIRVVGEKCKKNIDEDFRSSALGTPHNYKHSQEDQINLMSTVIFGGNAFLDTFNGQKFVPVEHTEDQVRAVFNSGHTLKAKCLKQLRDLEQTIMQSQDAEAIEAIEWTHITGE